MLSEQAVNVNPFTTFIWLRNAEFQIPEDCYIEATLSYNCSYGLKLIVFKKPIVRNAYNR